MKRLLVMLAAMGERANPVVVKELRQAVRSRLVIVILLGFLGVSLCLLGVRLAEDTERQIYGGAAAFGALMAVLSITCIVIVPLYVGVRMAFETGASSIDLMFATTLKSSAIVRGKFWAGMALVGLILSACMPFLTLTYLMRGVDLPTIFLLLALALLLSGAAMAGGLFAGTVSGGWISRGLTFLLLLGALIYMCGGFLTSIDSAMSYGRYGRVSFWAELASGVLVLASLAGLFYQFAVMGVTPKPANRTMRARIYITAIWLVNGVAAWIWSLKEDRPAALAWMYAFTVMMGISVLVAVSEREAWSPRIRRTIPRWLPARMLAFLFYCGSGGGLLWCCLLMLLTVISPVMMLFGDQRFGDWADEIGFHVAMCLALFGYVLCYGLSAITLRRILKMPIRFTSLLTVLLMIAGAVLPFLGTYLIHGPGPMDLPVAWMINPAAPLIAVTGNHYSWRGDGMSDQLIGIFVLLTAWGGVLALVNFPWLADQFLRFHPEAEEDDPPPPAA